jgi:endonuclease/exonuclease/phosphatase family metal-dependent hydrolase
MLVGLALALPGCTPNDLALDPGMHEKALRGATFTTLTYNVAGLLEPFSHSNPAMNTPIISCLIRGYDVVVLQEDFNYHGKLYDACDDHPYRSPTSGGMGIGSGLNMLSHFPYTDWARVAWHDCVGTDCLTPKGFTLARVRVAEGVEVDVYAVHAQARSGNAPCRARRANILQLARYVEAHSAGNAIMIIGDTNALYTRDRDNIGEFLKRGFRDVWIDRLRGGNVPVQGGKPLASCSPTMTSPDCELVDKALYRSSRAVTLEPLDYLVEDKRFVDAGGQPLSDHAPVKVTWRVTAASDRQVSDSKGSPHGFNDAALLPAAPLVTAVALRRGARVDQIGVTLR